MTNFSDVRIFFCTTPTRMNYSFDRLMGQAEAIFNQDPLSGHLFLFLNRSRDRIKILFWDRDGLCIFYKRLEAGTFQLPDFESSQHGIELTYAQLTNLLGGFDLKSGRRRRRYRRVGGRAYQDSFSRSGTIPCHDAS
jgi:transposase